MRKIHTLAELDALPAGAVVMGYDFGNPMVSLLQEWESWGTEPPTTHREWQQAGTEDGWQGQSLLDICGGELLVLWPESPSAD